MKCALEVFRPQAFLALAPFSNCPAPITLTLCEAGLWVQRLLRLQFHWVDPISRGSNINCAPLWWAQRLGLCIKLLHGWGKDRRGQLHSNVWEYRLVIGANLLSWLSLCFSIHMYSSATTVYLSVESRHWNSSELGSLRSSSSSSSHAALIKCTYRL